MTRFDFLTRYIILLLVENKLNGNIIRYYIGLVINCNSRNCTKLLLVSAPHPVSGPTPVPTASPSIYLK